MPNLLATAQSIAILIGISQPSQLVGAGDPKALRLLAVANEAGDDVLRAHIWSDLIETHTETLQSGTAVYSLPDDYLKLVARTGWDRSQYRELRLQTPQDYQRLKSGLVSAPANVRQIRFRGTTFEIFPEPASTGDVVAFEYQSKNWCESSGGTGQESLAADTDVIRLDNHVFKRAFIWRARRAFGMAYADEEGEYQRALVTAIRNDAPMPRTNIGGRPCSHKDPGIPEGSWNV